MSVNIEKLYARIEEKYGEQKEFLQVTHSFLTKIEDFIQKNEVYSDEAILRRMLEPDKIIDFRVSWVDSEGSEQLNRGYRVQFNKALGVYKGGLRFHPSVNISILKFLSFEQTLKNSLTGFNLGGAKGGADFNPGDYSDLDVMRFCQAFVTNLYNYTHYNTDVPAGDIGVGTREIGYLAGFTDKLKNSFSGAYTGKVMELGGSRLRSEATGYGCLYFLSQMLEEIDLKPKNLTINISGSGNVALHACEKAIEMGMKVQTLSDSGGTVFFEKGISPEQLKWIKELKFEKRGRISECEDKFGIDYEEGKKAWDFPCEVALPCATQNELVAKDAETLVNNKCKLVTEGANMPCTPEAVDIFHEHGILYAPGKASNAGGVTVSALEMAQNQLRHTWKASKVDDELRNTMKEIHDRCKSYGGKVNGLPDYAAGANIGGFVRVYNAMRDQGVF